MNPKSRIASELDALGFPPGAGEDDVSLFLGRAAHGVRLRAPHVAYAATVSTFTPDVDDFLDLADEDVSELVAFGDDEGDLLFLLDRTGALRFGPGAVFAVEKGALVAECLILISRSLPEFLAIFTDGAPELAQRVYDIRDGDGPGADVDPRFDDPKCHLASNAIRSARLRSPMTIDGLTYVPAAADPHIRFYRNGRVSEGSVAGGVVGGIPLVPGSRVVFDREGAPTAFTPAETVVLNGVRVRGGALVLRRGTTFFFTPDDNATYRGFRCRAGERVEDYGPGLGLHFTAAEDFVFKGRPVPGGARVTYAGGIRFDTPRELALEGRVLKPGTHVWYDFDGSIREIYVRD
jgi:hypothetical protein